MESGEEVHKLSSCENDSKPEDGWSRISISGLCYMAIFDP